MFAGLKAALKGSVGAHLSYEDLAATLGAPLTTPERLIGGKWAQDMFIASWRDIHGTSDWAAFSEHWRKQHILPRLRRIADEPIWNLQRRRVLDELFNEEEGLTTSGKVLKLADDETATFLIDYPCPPNAGRTIKWKRSSVGLEMCFQSLNRCALIEIATRGFGENSVDLDNALDFYGNAFLHLLAMQIATRNLHVVDDGCTPDDSRRLELASAPYSARMRAALNAIRLEISQEADTNGTKEKLRQQYNEILRAKSDFAREILEQESQTQFIEERDIA